MGAFGLTSHQINDWNVSHRLQKRSLLIAVNCIAGLSIFFFGYDQGVMGGVNTAKDYIDTMKFGYVTEPGNKVHITHPLTQGGIVAIYYLPGTLVGALLGGWIGEKIGRIRTIALGAAWAIIGATLQCSAQNANWMYCARVFNGIGTGILNAITPVWATETADHTSRGQFVAIEFTLNIFGVAVAYWLEFGLSFSDNGESALRWRFPIAFQIIPLIFLFFAVWFFPESPRWLVLMKNHRVKMGREDEAKYVLTRLRGGDEDSLTKGKAEAEFEDIRNVAELERKAAGLTSYWAMFLGKGSGKLHTGRRVQLVIWLQILQEWIGISGVTLFQPTIFALAGFSSIKVGWLSGLNTVTYTISTLLCVFTLDRIGRRWTLYWGSVAQGIAMIILGICTREVLNASAAGDTARAASFGAGAASMVFIFTAVFGATWLTVPWLYPAEIFPLAVRAKGNAWGVVGWSIGNGWTVLLTPTMFNNIQEKTYYIYAAVNVITIPIVWALYPESNQRTLEEMDLLFAADSIWNWEAEKNYRRLVEENPQIVQAAKRAQDVVDPETGEVRVRASSDGQGRRRSSLAAVYDEKTTAKGV